MHTFIIYNTKFAITYPPKDVDNDYVLILTVGGYREESVVDFIKGSTPTPSQTSTPSPSSTPNSSDSKISISSNITIINLFLNSSIIIINTCSTSGIVFGLSLDSSLKVGVISADSLADESSGGFRITLPSCC
ncbi:hypothetical protein ACTFIY_007386 [Dictyostelium cf. discoideum]